MRILASSPFVNSLEHITGFLVVLAALAVLWMLTTLIGKIFIRAGFVPATAGKAPAGDDNELDEEEVAAVAACIVTILGRRSRIVSIRRGRSTDWNREGRREHFSSRRIR